VERALWTERASTTFALEPAAKVVDARSVH